MTARTRGGLVFWRSAARFEVRGRQRYEQRQYLDALKAWRKAAAWGSSDAAFRIGMLYERGEGVLRNVPDAVVWYRRAAERDKAAFELEQMRAIQTASLPPAQQSEALVQQGNDYLQQGLVLEAEREFQNALGTDPGSAVAHG